MKRLLLSAAAIAVLCSCGEHRAAGPTLSPGDWPTDERERLEKLESRTWSPLEARTVGGAGGIVSATVSPLASYAGIQALKRGGNAADAAATTALTQVTLQLGSVVSYAGIFTMLYYDASSNKVYSMDAGYNSYLHETDPGSIPVGDLGPLNFGRKPTEGGAKGRETLVPGFMAGVEAMHGRFGRLPFGELFEPAIWYADHGVRISPSLEGLFAMRARFLGRTPEGRDFMRQAGDPVPKAGDLFVQGALAATLRAIAADGASYMYTGQWGRDFVRIVNREGGKATPEDLARYRPIWSDPYKESAFGRTIYVNGPPHYGAYNLFAGLNLAEALGLDDRGAYWADPVTFQALARINDIVGGALAANKEASDFFRANGIDISARAQLDKEYARAIAPYLDRFFSAPTENSPKHSNAIVVVDRDGNIAAITHTINAVVWGDTGIVVDGIPIPDSAAFQQTELASIKPGERLQHGIIDTIAFDGDRPVLATGSIGASLAPETLRVLFSLLGQHKGLAEVLAAPPVLAQFSLGTVDSIASRQPVLVPQGAYGAGFLAKLRAKGMVVTEVPLQTAAGLRGTLAAVAIDPRTGAMTGADQPGVMVFNSAY
jgi:gamma-glutamyltranspeptidase/glutathione hydrolase